MPDTVTLYSGVLDGLTTWPVTLLPGQMHLSQPGVASPGHRPQAEIEANGNVYFSLSAIRFQCHYKQ